MTPPPTKRSIANRLESLEEVDPLAAEHYFVSPPGSEGVDDFEVMGRTEFLLYMDGLDDEEFEEVGVTPLGENELANMMMDTLREAYSE